MTINITAKCAKLWVADPCIAFTSVILAIFLSIAVLPQSFLHERCGKRWWPTIVVRPSLEEMIKEYEER